MGGPGSIMAAQQDPQPLENAALPETAPAPLPRMSVFQRIAAIVYALFCFEVGAFLVMFPWHPLWNDNYFANFTPGWYAIWTSPYVRGAVSGLGLVNMGVAVAEIFRLRRP